MYRIAAYTIICIGAVFAAHAQYRSAPVWCFGDHAGLEFTGGNPVPFQTAIYTQSAVPSTQCDAAGNILFYANGLKIWDANGNVMPGSSNPLWNVYTSGWNLNAMIIPDAADSNRYFVFTTFPSKGSLPYGTYFVGQLTYSVVDMRLNNGAGDVVSGLSHILLDTNCGHFMTIVPGSNCNYWVVVQTGKSVPENTFKCYEVNAGGVTTTPVVSKLNSIPTLLPGHIGQGIATRAGNMIYSHTRHKLIGSYESGDVTAYDINTATGVVSNPNALTWAYPPAEGVNSTTIPAICLSPDESLLYVSGYATSVPGAGFILSQFPLIGSGSSLTVGSPVTIFNPPTAALLGVQQPSGAGWQKSAMQLGPDNKIYHTFTMGQNFMGRINNPDVAGLNCNFVPDEIHLTPNTYTTSSMPAPMFRRLAVEQTKGNKNDTTACFQPSVQLNAPVGYLSYTWQNGWRSPLFTTTSSGTYIVTSTDKECRQRRDTFDLHLVQFDLSLGRDIKTCFNTVLGPVTNIPATAMYNWSDGSKQSTLAVNGPGGYWVQVAEHGCVAADTIEVDNEYIAPSLPQDTAICTGTHLQLDATVTGAVYLWQDGSTGAYFNADKKGIYSVVVTKGYCTAVATTNLAEEYCDNCLSAVPNAFTPNNDGRNDVFRPVFYPLCPIDEYKFSVYNRFGQRVFISSDPKQGWDGTYNGTSCDLGTYFYYLQFKGPQGKAYFHKGDIVLIR